MSLFLLSLLPGESGLLFNCSKVMSIPLANICDGISDCDGSGLDETFELCDSKCTYHSKDSKINRSLSMEWICCSWIHGL
jgi:hypothetical protein